MWSGTGPLCHQEACPNFALCSTVSLRGVANLCFVSQWLSSVPPRKVFSWALAKTTPWLWDAPIGEKLLQWIVNAVGTPSEHQSARRRAEPSAPDTILRQSVLCYITTLLVSLSCSRTTAIASRCSSCDTCFASVLTRRKGSVRDGKCNSCQPLNVWRRPSTLHAMRI